MREARAYILEYDDTQQYRVSILTCESVQCSAMISFSWQLPDDGILRPKHVATDDMNFTRNHK
jgi:hypothetical protein